MEAIPLEYDAVNSTDTSANTLPSTLSWKESLISLVIFVFAGLLEIGGGYLVWIALRESRKPAWLYIFFGFVLLMGYGVVPTLQPSDSFG